MDYPHSYSSCGYSGTYGWAPSGDYAYSLDQPLTSDTTAVSTAINGLVLGSGFDGPQDYTRIFYESYADPLVDWRDGAKKLLVNFGDNVPHDCNINEGISSVPESTGGDPGRDEIMNTADDLDLQLVLASMNSNGVTLIECHRIIKYEAHWRYWTGLTGGDFYLTSSSTLVSDVVTAVITGLEVPKVYDLHLRVVTSGFDDWIIFNPGNYNEVPTGTSVTFDETICVPSDALPDTYVFTKQEEYEARIAIPSTHRNGHEHRKIEQHCSLY